MKNMVGMTILLFITLLPRIALSTDVGGIIATDTTWGLNESPYDITSTVQISQEATLTIEPGVMVLNGDIEVWGVLNAIGSEDSKISLGSVEISPGYGNYGDDGVSAINIQHAIINGGRPYCGDGYGSITLRDSTVTNTDYIYLWYPQNDCYFERNIFSNAGGLSVGSRDSNVYIRNNVFYDTSGYAIENWANYGDAETIVENNSFLSTDRIALQLPSGYSSSAMYAVNNYWNTTNLSVIESMIYDKNDDLSCADYIEFEPILTEPHPDTPTLDINQPPTADAGIDQVSCGVVNLDGSVSTDIDGSIISYDWQLHHWENQSYDQVANGVNPTITDLENGFYDVTLLVTDDGGLVATDDMVLAVTNDCGSGCEQAVHIPRNGIIHIPDVKRANSHFSYTLREEEGLFRLINIQPLE